MLLLHFMKFVSGFIEVYWTFTDHQIYPFSSLHSVKPLEVSIIAPKARVFSAGIRSELVCRSSGSRPPAQITWWRNGNRVTMSSSSTSGGTTIPYSVFHETTSAFVMMTSSREVVEAQQQTKQSSSPYHHPLALIGNSNKYQSHQKQQGQMAHPTMSSHSSVTSSTTYNIRQTQSPDGNVSLSSLSFIPAPDDDGSTISCRVHNIHLPRSDPMEESIQLRVQCKLSTFEFCSFDFELSPFFVLCEFVWMCSAASCSLCVSLLSFLGHLIRDPLLPSLSSSSCCVVISYHIIERKRYSILLCCSFFSTLHPLLCHRE